MHLYVLCPLRTQPSFFSTVSQLEIWSEVAATTNTIENIWKARCCKAPSCVAPNWKVRDKNDAIHPKGGSGYGFKSRTGDRTHEKHVLCPLRTQPSFSSTVSQLEIWSEMAATTKTIENIWKARCCEAPSCVAPNWKVSDNNDAIHPRQKGQQRSRSAHVARNPHLSRGWKHKNHT